MCKKCKDYSDYYYNAVLMMQQQYSLILNALEMQSIMNSFHKLRELQINSENCDYLRDGDYDDE